MTPHATRLLHYTMTHGGISKEQATAWLNDRVPGWQNHNEPKATRSYNDSPDDNSED